MQMAGYKMHSEQTNFGLLVAAVVLTIAGCGGGTYGGSSDSGSSATPDSNQDTFATDRAFFDARVAPRMEFCRSCHVPGGIADTDDGRRFLLSRNPAEDYDNFYASWQRLGRGTDLNLILTKGSNTADERHDGGGPWPVGSDAYSDVLTLFICWDNPQACDLTTGGGEPITDELPLLGSARGSHLWFDYCEGKPDNEPVPQDPRELVVPGINTGKAVYMNGWWQTCQDDNHPGNCGELRARYDRGYRLVASDSEVGAGHFFGGNYTDAGFAFPASDYNTLWSAAMGLSERPDNFDQLISERWGMPLSQTHNPYPLPGEDPNQTNGGNGQLPIGLTHLRNEDGSWTGRLNVTCSICHGGEVGTPEDGPLLGTMYGTNSISDITVMFTDLSQIAPQQSALAIVSQNKVRGTGNITNFQLFGTLLLTDEEAAPSYPTIQAEPSTGTEDPPVWWNVGHRSVKFFDGAQVMDSKRIELSFHFPNTPNHPNLDEDKQWIIDHQQDSDTWLLGLRSPEWPVTSLGGIDTQLAEQGAVLFHSKDLWADNQNEDIPTPDGGNGSCASCHGAYAPRFVNDPEYLDTPLLAGMAAHIVPMETILTDPRRQQGNSERVQQASRSNWFAYHEGPLNEKGVSLCGNWNDPDLRGDRKLGYLAPPLYGVWATAPYFHNGAVPTVRQVLRSDERPDIWRRLSKTPRTDQAGRVVMGYRTDLGAYNASDLGWQHEELPCGVGSTQFIDCNPVIDDGATLQDALSVIWVNGGLAWNLLNPPIMSNDDLEQRKIYNTYYYSQDNGGHTFTDVLTDQEVLAIIEYMKTL